MKSADSLRIGFVRGGLARVPCYLRSDHRPEFNAAKVRQWFAQVQLKTPFIELGSPWEAGQSVGDWLPRVLQWEAS